MSAAALLTTQHGHVAQGRLALQLAGKLDLSDTGDEVRSDDEAEESIMAEEMPHVELPPGACLFPLPICVGRGCVGPFGAGA